MNDDDMYDAFERADEKHDDLRDRVKVIEAVFDTLFLAEFPSMAALALARKQWVELRPK